MGQPAVVSWGVEFDPALLTWPDINPGEWFPDTPPPKALHKLHWRRRLAMLQAIGDECSQTPIGAP
jgi:hypothetical protein